MLFGPLRVGEEVQSILTDRKGFVLRASFLALYSLPDRPAALHYHVRLDGNTLIKTSGNALQRIGRPAGTSSVPDLGDLVRTDTTVGRVTVIESDRYAREPEGHQPEDGIPLRMGPRDDAQPRPTSYFILPMSSFIMRNSFVERCRRRQMERREELSSSYPALEEARFKAHGNMFCSTETFGQRVQRHIRAMARESVDEELQMKKTLRGYDAEELKGPFSPDQISILRKYHEYSSRFDLR